MIYLRNDDTRNNAWINRAHSQEGTGMSAYSYFSKDDHEQFKARNISIEAVEAQLAIFERGPNYIDIVRPCTLGDGIRKLEPGQVEHFVQIYEKALVHKNCAKFIPASGASTRMFKDLYTWRDHQLSGDCLPLEEAARDGDKEAVFIKHFISNLEEFAFYPLISRVYEKQQKELELHLDEEFPSNEQCLDIVNTVLDPSGLGYGNFPKGLLKFHRYGEFMRTPFEEHLVEAAQYGRTAGNHSRVHYTVGADHVPAFKLKYETIKQAYQNFIGVEYHVDFSVQSQSTDTLAVTPDNMPFRKDDGSLLFRPGGHGSLVGNLNHLNYDIIFINNIDNVVPDRIKAERALWKKALAGFMVFIQDRTFRYINLLSQGEISPKVLGEAIEFASEFFCLQSHFENVSDHEARTRILNLFNRPVRICGMVKNEGDPGGAPFWTRARDGNFSVQIVESAQINKDSPESMEIFSSSTHFNPVDVVCGVKDYQGNKFDLTKFIDHEAVFISEKSLQGRPLRALEHPGLWNGSMSAWNTIFLEVPKAAFNPVKSVNDLLLPSHQV